MGGRILNTLINTSRGLRLTGVDNTPLFVTDWPADDAQTGEKGIVLMHGLGEHSGRYAHVVRFFNDAGWSVRTYDHRGHGRSGGTRGDVPDANAVLQDAKIVIDDFAKQLSAPPLLLGHSMGGLFAARFATARLSPLRGLILSSPALAIPLTGAQKTLLRILRTVAPGVGISNGLDANYLSRRPEVVQAYKQDSLVHGKISARLLGSMLSAVDFAHSQASALQIPTLMVVAGADRIVAPVGSQTFFKRLAPGIGTLHYYQDYYHELFNDADAQRVFTDIHNWLNTHMR